MTGSPTRNDSPGARLRALLARPGALMLPGCADPLTAKLAERAGFEAIYATGAGIANSLLGVADVGLTTMTEIADQLRRITAVVNAAVVVDIDTGFGNAINARRAVQEMERAGAAAVQIEDQVFPKRCGHFSGKDVISQAEMVAKLHAVLDARRDPNLVVIARTDAIAVHGFEAGVARALAYAEAGADMIFVEAATTDEQLAALPRLISAPLVANMVEGGKTPLHSVAELGDMGYGAVIFANAAMRMAAAAVRDTFAEMRATGDTRGLLDRMLSWPDRQALVGLPEIEALEARYRVD